MEKREHFGTKFGALMTMVGMAIGLGNIWRFPYLVGQNGGGAFVVAYLIAMLVIVVPLCIVEMGMGKGVGKGTIDAFKAALNNKKGSGLLGSFGAIVFLGANLFYIATVGIAVYYIYVCARGLWNSTPTETIYTDVMNNPTIIFVIFAAITLFVGYVVARGVVSGVEKISKFLVPGIFICFIILALYCLTIPNISEGYKFYLHSDWDKLKDINVWISAVGQGFFSTAVGAGAVLVYGSRLNKDDDVTVTSLSMCFADISIALLAGFAIIPATIALGFNPESGPRLMFIVVPELLASIPGGQVLGIIIFTGVFFAGVTSAIAQLDTPTTTFADGLGKSRVSIVWLCTAITLVLGGIAVFYKPLNDLFESLVGNYGYTIAAGIGAIIFSWFYGVKKIRKDFINNGSYVKVGSWFDILVKFIATPIVIYIIVTSLIG